MKKLINGPADVVREALRGMAIAHPELRVDHANKIVYRADAPVRGKVGLIGLGVDALSVTPPAIPATKEAVRAVDTREARRRADEALCADSAAAVREQLVP